MKADLEKYEHQVQQAKVNGRSTVRDKLVILFGFIYKVIIKCSTTSYGF